MGSINRKLSTVSISKPSYQRPNLQSSLFSGRKSIEIANTPLDTYPNPLYSMDKEQIRALKPAEYMHLLQIPYKNVSETDKFCWHITELVNENIISDSRRASILLMCIADNELTDRIVSALSAFYKNDIIKQSILTYMTTPSNPSWHKLLNSTLEYILKSQESSEPILKYLDTLASIQRMNEIPIIWKPSFFNKISKLIPRSDYATFFSCLFNLNIQPYLPYQLNPIKSVLAGGSNLEKYVLRTGLLHAKWHDTQLVDFDELHKQKMVQFYSMDELRNYALYAIKQEDVIESNLYLSLLVEKFELKCKFQNDPETNPSISTKKPLDTSITQDLQSVLYVILNHIMVFKGSEHCIKVLKYMLKNHLEVNFKTLIAVMNNLRRQGYYNEALILMKNINLNDKTKDEKQILVEEILSLIIQKYPREPKILLGYMLAFSQNIPLFHKLQLLKVIYGSDNDIEHWENSIQIANVDPKLKESRLSSQALSGLYQTVLQTMKKENIYQQLRPLYHSYMEHVPQLKNYQHDDKIITLFLKYLLKRQPNSKKMDVYENLNNYTLAKEIFESFHENKVMSSGSHTVYLYDLLIYSSLMVHKDYVFAANVIKKSRSLGLPLSFNQIYPFIMFHYSRNEFEQAEMWYRELVKHGVKAKATPVKEVFRIARELNWEVSGFVYRKYGILSNQKKRSELKKVSVDRISFIEKEELEENVTDELVGGGYEEEGEINLGDEISNLLFEIEHKKD
ncbi:hypothetical protein CAAN1_04S07690 [[Candida] anglica]|uniref:Pentatricopeptide repeat-containing protein n=1 Tax=[Candida] anglica TaxID=148631 RepID=A0ABP0E8E5_9ASCO